MKFPSLFFQVQSRFFAALMVSIAFSATSNTQAQENIPVPQFSPTYKLASQKEDHIGEIINTSQNHDYAPLPIPAPEQKMSTVEKPQANNADSYTDTDRRKQNEDFIQKQILQSDLSQKKEEILLKAGDIVSPPVPKAAPKNDVKQVEVDFQPIPEEQNEHAPVLTVPIPILMSVPVPEPMPLPKPDNFDDVAPQAEPYEAVSDAPITYPQSNSITQGFPRFGDRKPHIWTSRRKPWHYAIHGTDVSWHNQDINWGEMIRNRISFVFIKATEGGDYSDPTFKQNWQAAKAAGLQRGAYHFYYFCRSAKEQLNWFIKNVPRDKNSLPPVLDMEWNHASTTCRRRPPPSFVRKEMRVFLKGAERYYGKKPIIYTSVDFFQDNNLGRVFKNYPFWLRSVAAHPSIRYNNHPWLFWQYTGTGRVPGIAGDADINAFVGNAKQWQSWLNAVNR